MRIEVTFDEIESQLRHGLRHSVNWNNVVSFIDGEVDKIKRGHMQQAAEEIKSLFTRVALKTRHEGYGNPVLVMEIPDDQIK